MGLVMTRMSNWKKCRSCSDIERYCLERALIGDILFILRIAKTDGFTNDTELQYGLQKLEDLNHVLDNMELVV
jgi:hypothetical protein